MKNVSAVKLAVQAFQGGDAEAARAVLEEVDPSLLWEDVRAEYDALCEALAS